MNELEIYCKQCIENGGKAWLLAECRDYVLYKFQTWRIVNYHEFGDTPVYQVFDKATGKRLYSTTNLNLGYSWMSGGKRK